MQHRILGTHSKARVKCVSVHKTDPLGLVCIYNGTFEVWNMETRSVLKTGSIGEIPIRAGAFIEEAGVLAIGSDDGLIRVYSTDTLEPKQKVQAHADFIRKILVHPELPYALTCSDDATVKLWDHSREFAHVRTLEGHTHFVMDASFSPRDPRLLITCSLDHTLRIWNLETGTGVRTLEGHKKGVNCVAYITDQYAVSGSDDGQVNIWDTFSGTLVTSIPAHSGPVTCIWQQPRGFLTAGEDGVIRAWNKKKFRPESSICPRMQRLWSVSSTPQGIVLAGGDDGVCFAQQLREEVLADFRVINSDARIVTVSEGVLKQQKTSNISAVKTIATLGHDPDRIELSPTGRYLAIETDGETVIYTLLGFIHQVTVQGTALSWTGPEDFIVLEKGIEVYKEFERTGSISLEFGARALKHLSDSLIMVIGDDEVGRILSEGKVVRETGRGVKGIEVVNGRLIVIYGERIELLDGAMKLLSVLRTKVSSWCVAGDMVAVSGSSRLGYVIVPEARSEMVVCQMERELSAEARVLGVLNGVWVLDSDKVFSVDLNSDLIAFQRSVVNGTVPGLRDSRLELNGKLVGDDRLIKECVQFLVGLSKFKEAHALSRNKDEKFELLVRLGKLEEAMEAADSDAKYSRLCGLFVARGEIDKALRCSKKGGAVEDQVLLTALCGDEDGLKKCARTAVSEGKLLIGLAAAFRSGLTDVCRDVLEPSEYSAVFKKHHNIQ